MNLLSKLHRNSILTGPIESYCLACGCLLRSEEESYAHIHEPGHADKLSSVSKLADYNECIIKVKEGYFCQYCNIILPTIKRVGLHVTESKHSDNKISLSVTRHGGVILVFDSVLINDRSWNGLDGSTCSVCNEDYDDEEHHRRGTTHLLNLIQIKCEFGETYVYRKVDEELFFCLICNAILPVPEKEDHHKSEKHLELFEKSKAEGTAVRNQKIEANRATSLVEPNNNTVRTPEAKTSQVLKTKVTEDIKPKTQDNKTKNGSAVDINDSRTANCKNIEKPATLTEKAPNLSYSKTIITASHPIKLDSQNITSPTPNLKVAAKVNLANEQSKESQNKDKSKTVAKDAETKSTETAKDKVDEPKAKLHNEVNGKPKIQADNPEPYLYEYLKDRNFVIKAHDATGYCTLCDIKIDDSDIDTHSRDEHHKVLYSKHVARRTKQSKTLTNGELKAESKAVINKENVAPVTAQNRNTSQADSKPIEAKAKVAANKSKNTEKESAPIKPVIPLPPIPFTDEKDPKLSISVKKENVIEQPSGNKLSENQTKSQEFNQNVESSITSVAKNDNNSISNETKHQEKEAPKESSAQINNPTKKSRKKASKVNISQTNTVLPKQVQKTESEVPEDLESAKSKAETSRHPKNNNKLNDSKPKEKENVSKQTDNKILSEADLKTENLLSLLQTVSHVDSVSDVVINGKHVLGNISFVLVIRTEDKAECVACDAIFSIDDINMHVSTDGHRSNVEECAVVTSLEDEFIRKVKTQGYHCGYCNKVIPNWDDMKLHLASYGHSDAKTAAMWRLVRYQSLLLVAGTREVRSILSTIFRCTME